MRIAPIVEGDGEIAAVPVLLRRIVQSMNPLVTPVVARPFKQTSGGIRRAGGLERSIEAVAQLYPNHCILLLIDSDDDCPRDLGRELLQRARASRPDLRVIVVIAKSEYEAWFLASADSLAGKKRLRADMTPPENPEEVRGAKEWLSDQMPGSARYSPTVDQAALSALMDLDLARQRSRSFRKLWKEIALLLDIH